MIRAHLSTGDEGQAVLFDGRLLHLICPRALAPGQPVELELGLSPPLHLSGRSQGSKKRADGEFDVRFRLINLRRADRQRLSAQLAGG